LHSCFVFCFQHILNDLMLVNKYTRHCNNRNEERGQHVEQSIKDNSLRKRIYTGNNYPRISVGYNYFHRVYCYLEML
jgi:hypothetical protein